MIVNELEYYELASLLQPVLRLGSLADISSTFQKILQVEVQSQHDIICQRQVLLRYKEYKIDIQDFRWIDEKGLSVYIQFSAKKKWWHGLIKDQNQGIINDLERICTTEIEGLKFAKYTRNAPFDHLSSEPPSRLLYFHDSRALNRHSNTGFDLSPLVIAPDAHHGKCFIEFLFNAGGYEQVDNKTRLRGNWDENAFDILEGIHCDARRAMGLE